MLWLTKKIDYAFLALHVLLTRGNGETVRVTEIAEEWDVPQKFLSKIMKDLVDAKMDDLNHLADMLAQIRPPLGKFAVLGNHELYAGVAQSKRFLEAAGFKVLRNQPYRLDGVLTIVGVDDPAGSRHKGNRAAEQKEAALLSEVDSQEFTLLLKHRPLVVPESKGRFDLQLSGHTHGGQIFPFTLITALFYTNQTGLASLDKNSLLYVSRGAGTWGPPMRLLAPPQVTLIELHQ